MDTKIYPIGTMFKPIGKHTQETKVIDILKTYNSQNELVAIRYVGEHEFCGQKVVNKDIVAVTIARGFIK